MYKLNNSPLTYCTRTTYRCNGESIVYVLNRKPNKTGKRTMYFITINNKRLNSINYSRKGAVENLFEVLIKKYGIKELKNKFYN